MNDPNQSPLEEHKDDIIHLYNEAKKTGRPPVGRILTALDNRGIPSSERSVNRALRRWGVTGPKQEQPGVQINGDEGTVTSSPESDYDLSDPDKLLRERKLDPDEWVINSIKVNEWQSANGEPLHQLVLNCKRKKPLSFPQPAQVERYKPLRTAGKSRDSGEPTTVVFTGDQQAPYHDLTLHGLFLKWLAYNEPERGVLIGDTIDLPDISRHRYNPEGTAKVQECLNSGYAILRDYVDASLSTSWQKLAGNHDERIRNTLIDWAVQLYGVRPADIPGEDQEAPALSIEHLLHLKDLGIEYMDPKGPYEHAQVNVSKYLSAIHGWLAVKGSGVSALRTLDHLGYSVVMGHTHRQSLVYKTTHDIDGKPSTLVAAETGCMCKIEGGLGYAVAPDWQNGFATATIWPDGKFRIDHATYFDGTLMYRDQRYS